MRKIIIVCSIIMIVVIALLHKQIYQMCIKNQIKNDIINDLNGNFGKRTSEITKTNYALYQRSIVDINHYDITELINKYIEIVEDSIEFKKGNKDIIDKYLGYEVLNRAKKNEFGVRIFMSYEPIMEAVSKNLTMQDINNHDNGTFNKLLIDKLKKCLDYNEQDGKIEWQINSVQDKIINLPFDSYIDYVAYHREKNTDFKKAINVIFDNDFQLKKHLNKVIVEYETPNGVIKKQETVMYHNERDGKDYYEISLTTDGLLLKHDNVNANVNLSNHTYDIMSEEANQAYIDYMLDYIN